MIGNWKMKHRARASFLLLCCIGLFFSCRGNGVDKTFHSPVLFTGGAGTGGQFVGGANMGGNARASASVGGEDGGE